METSPARRDFLLGAIFFGSILALIYYTIVLTGFSFRPKTTMQVAFADANGLKEGDAVLVTGRKTGVVRLVEYYEDRPLDRRIVVTLELDQPVSLRQPYAVRIAEFTVLGGRVVEIEPGPLGGELVPPSAELLGSVGVSALESLAELVEENRDNLRQTLDNLRRASDDLAQGRGALGALFNDPELRADLDAILADVRQLAADLRSGKGTVGMLIEDKEVRDRVVSLLNDGASAAANFRVIAEDLAAGRGTAGAFLADEAMRADSVALIENLRASSDTLRRVLAEADQGRGLLGRLVADEEFSKDAEELLANLAELSRKLTEGEGTLGRLVAEDEAYDEVITALRSLNAQLEDAREAQPVSSFAQMLFGAF